MKKRILTLLFSVLMLLSTFQCILAVNAADTASYDDVSIESWYFQPDSVTELW